MTAAQQSYLPSFPQASCPEIMTGGTVEITVSIEYRHSLCPESTLIC